MNWTTEEIELLKEKCTLPIKELCELFNRTAKSINHKIERLGLDKTYRWSEQEVEILLTNTATPIDDLQKLLPNRNDKAIYHKCVEMGVSRTNHGNTWKVEELEILKDNSKLSLNELIPSKRLDAIKLKRSKLGLKNKHDRKWLPEEIEILKELGPHKYGYELASILNRGVEAVLSKLKKNMESKRRQNFGQNTLKDYYVIFHRVSN